MTAAIRQKIEQSEFFNFGVIKTLFSQMLDLIDTQQQKIVPLEAENDNKNTTRFLSKING